VLGIALRALRGELGRPDPLVVSAYFLRPILPRAAELTTEVARTGGRISTGAVRRCRHGKQLLRVVAGFADLAQAGGRATVFADAPSPRRSP
jgi:acyl-CoA thioesterase